MTPLLLAAGMLAQGLEPSDEARAFAFLEQARFDELAAFLQKRPKGDALRAALEEPTRRLVEGRLALIAALNRRELEIDLKDVHPAAPRGGRIVGATATTIMVKGEDRERALIWAGLPPETTLRMAERFLARETQNDPALLVDLAAGLGVGGPPEVARGVEAARAVRAALAERSFEEARKALEGLPAEAPARPWPALARVWIDRLRTLTSRRDERRAAAVKTLPPAARLIRCDDFEEGPELVAPLWQRGLTVEPPGGSLPTNRWCRRSVFLGRGLHTGEMLDELQWNREEAAFVLADRTFLTCRVWAENVDTLRVALESYPRQGPTRVSVIEVPLEARGMWVDLNVRLDDVARHRAFQNDPLVRLGDTLRLLSFRALRADPANDQGQFYLDDLRVWIEE